jgi:hypothetical protein
MKPFQSSSLPLRSQAAFYAVTSFVGGIISNTSLLIIILWFGFAAAAATFDTAKSFWHHPGVRSFVAALEAELLAEKSSSAVDLNAQSPLHFKDPEKVQREENRARRKLVADLKRRASK